MIRNILRCALHLLSVTMILVLLNSFVLPISTTERKHRVVVVLECAFGLSNRLRAYASVASVVKRYKLWELFLVWPKDIHLNSEFLDLFEKPALVSNIYSSYEQMRSLLSKSFGNIKWDVYDLTVVYAPGTELGLPTPVPGSVVYIKSNVRVVFKDEELQSDSSLCYELQNLKLSKTLHVRYMRTKHRLGDLSGMTGVHIRMLVNQANDIPGVDKDLLMLSRMNAAKTLESRQSCHYESFARVFNEILKNDSKARFLLTTDSHEALINLRVLYGDRILIANETAHEICSGTAEARNWECLAQALIDQHLLSKTKQFISSTWSSFSEVIKMLGEFQNDKVLQGCGQIRIA